MITLKKKFEQILYQRPGFWFFQIVGWFLMFLLDFFQMYEELVNFKMIYTWLISLLTGFFITLVLHKIYRYVYSRKKSIYLYLVLVPISSLIAGFVWFIVKYIIVLPISDVLIFDSKFNINTYTIDYILHRMISFSWVFMVWSILYFVLKFWIDLLEAKKNFEKASLLAQKSQLQMLRYQLNPHFLFNSLNSIQALIYEDPAHADRMITELADFLRFTLRDKDKLFVKLDEEILVAEKYLSMEKTRFPDRINYYINITEEASKHEVIAFLLQPFVENAIKHGLKSSPEKLDITIDCYVEKGTLVIKISNTGKWVDNENHYGTGIQNVFDRLGNAFPGKHSIHIIKNDKSVCVIIEILP